MHAGPLRDRRLAPCGAWAYMISHVYAKCGRHGESAQSLLAPRGQRRRQAAVVVDFTKRTQFGTEQGEQAALGQRVTAQYASVASVVKPSRSRRLVDGVRPLRALPHKPVFCKTNPILPSL